MNTNRIAASYEETWLEVTRPKPLSDNRLDSFIQEILSGSLKHDISDQVYEDFKTEAEQWIFGSKLNNFTGIDAFTRKDIITGCTQFIDNLYMQGPVQVLRKDYRYHQRLKLAESFHATPGTFEKFVPLIIAMPFPSTGSIYEYMDDVLDECLEKSIPVHIDGAWITCSKDITFDFSHPAIKSVGVSLSKGLSLGWNRVGVRWSRDVDVDSITLMNDFHMNNRVPTIIGLHYIRNFPQDYLWNTHGERYYKVCKDFGLTPTNSIQLALRNGEPVGISPLIRYLENERV